MVFFLILFFCLAAFGENEAALRRPEAIPEEDNDRSLVELLNQIADDKKFF